MARPRVRTAGAGLAVLIALLAPGGLGHAASTRFLVTGGGRLGYDDTGGDGPLVIAVPGMGDLRQSYRFLVPALVRAGYRVATLDLRGFGDGDAHWPDYSPSAVAGDMLVLQARLERPRAVLMANSYAGAAAIQALHDAPGRVRALVLLDPVLTDPPAQSWLMRAGMTLAFAGPWNVHLWLGYWDSLFPSRTPPDQAAYRLALDRDLHQPGRMAALAAVMRTSRAATTAILGQRRAPTLLVMGTRDGDFDDPSASGRADARILGAQLLLVPGAGHYPQAEMPEQVAPVLLRFLAALPP